MKNIGFRFGVVAVVLALAIYALVPSFNFYSKSEEERERIRLDEPGKLKNTLNLGLDLQGGMRMVLEIDRSKLDADDRDVIDRAYAIIGNRIDQLGVTEPVLQKQGANRIIVELPGVKDAETAEGIIGKTAQLEFNLVLDAVMRNSALSVIDSVVRGTLSADADTAAAGDAAETAADDRGGDAELDALLGRADSPIAAADTADSDSFLALIDGSDGDVAVIVRASNVRRVSNILRRADVNTALRRKGLGGNAFLWGHEEFSENNSPVKYKYLYYVRATPEMKGDVIETASHAVDQSGMNAGKAKVDMAMKPRGARDFARITGQHIGKHLAIVLDSTVYSAPRIQSRISGGRAEITGNFTVPEARALAIILRAGALPAPVEIIEKRIVGPSLGQDAIEKGIMAGVIGTALIIVFMMAYYKLSGIIALFALLLNMLIVLATMAAFNATLTMPGIAGLILLIGMGVDANVLILERVKEELRLGRTVRSAIEQGYSNALSAILDANITTIMTGLILLWKGTGPIRGFAVTLIIGISASLFTALFVSKLLMETFYQKRAKISI